MSRPGLIVGIGGTGQWVLTWLKRDLMVWNGGKMPDNIRLMSIDTTSQLEAAAKHVNTSAGGDDEQLVEVGGISLDRSEFIHIGGDSMPQARLVRDGQLKHIGSWYKADQWLSTQPSASFILDDGAGRIRQFGRMAVFKDLLNKDGSEIWRRFKTTLESIQSTTSESRRLEVMVVGSFAGGTGSGIFLDLALILRMLAQQKGIHHVLRGFFALPSVFTDVPSQDMMARTFSAWRELNRFMVVDEDFPMPEIRYSDTDTRFSITPNQRIFDACYLVDGKREGKHIAEESKYGVFPMMSEVVSAILDDEAGQKYTNYITTNLAPEYSKNPNTPMYSAIGAYSIQVPAHFVQEKASYKLGKDVLLELLKPVKGPDNFGNLISSGAERHKLLAAVDRNQEDPGFSGRYRSRMLFTETLNVAGSSMRPALFMSRIADINQGIQDGKIAGMIDDYARAASANSNRMAAKNSWVGVYADLGDAPEYDALKKDIDIYIQYDPRKLARRQGEQAEEARQRFTGIPEDVRVRFGGNLAGEEGVEEYYGEFGSILEEVKDAHIKVFQRQTRIKITQTLMGTHEDLLIARRGKIGYAWDFFDGVVNELDTVLSFLRDVQIKREQNKPALKLKESVLRAENIMKDLLGKRFFLFWEHPQVKKSEDAYLQIMNSLISYRREEIIHNFIIRTVQSMKLIAEDARDELLNWIWYLSTGDDSRDLAGLWDAMRSGDENVDRAHAFDEKIGKVQSMVANQLPEFSEAEIRDTLKNLEWRSQIDDSTGKLRIALNVLPQDEDAEPESLGNPVYGGSSAQRKALEGTNFDKYINMNRRQFAGIVARSTVMEAIQAQYPNPQKFALSVDKSAEPLIELYGGEAAAKKKSNLIRVQSDDEYFTGELGVKGELRDLAGENRAIPSDYYNIDTVGSENPYKFTLVRTDDLYEFSHWEAWHRCKAAYEAHVRGENDLLDPVLLQNFAAEAEAVALERRFVQQSKQFRPLHPRVVMLLEDRNALRQYFYLAMLGFIRQVDQDGVFRYELTWKKSSGEQTIWLTRGWNQDRDSSRPKPDIFHALHGYVLRRKTHQPGRTDEIDTGFANRIIDEYIPNPEHRIEMIQMNLKEGGLISNLEKRAYDPDKVDPNDSEKGVIRPDYRDLAEVAKIILESRLETLEQKVDQIDQVIFNDDVGTIYRPGA